MILDTAMKKEGFINYPTEWWHYSYGDKYWAYILFKPIATYSQVNKDPPMLLL